MARFRSLQETSVVLEFISKKGLESAKAYIDYLIIAEMKEEKYFMKIYGKDYKIHLTDYYKLLFRKNMES